MMRSNSISKSMEVKLEICPKRLMLFAIHALEVASEVPLARFYNHMSFTP
jgi:hypothetical protein